MHKCTSVTVTVHICMVIVAFLYIILIISNFTPFFFSLFSICKTNTSSVPHHLLLPLIHTLPQTQINHKNKKSTTKSTTDTIKPNTPIERQRMNWHLQISACGSANIGAWIGVSERSFSPCLDQSSSRRAWIGFSYGNRESLR